jgi:hypothetical protein
VKRWARINAFPEQRGGRYRPKESEDKALLAWVRLADEGILMAGIISEEQLLRELRVLYANRPLQFTKLIMKYYKGERAKQIIETLKTWPSS